MPYLASIVAVCADCPAKLVQTFAVLFTAHKCTTTSNKPAVSCDPTLNNPLLNQSKTAEAVVLLPQISATFNFKCKKKKILRINSEHTVELQLHSCNSLSSLFNSSLTAENTAKSISFEAHCQLKPVITSKSYCTSTLRGVVSWNRNI